MVRPSGLVILNRLRIPTVVSDSMRSIQQVLAWSVEQIMAPMRTNQQAVGFSSFHGRLLLNAPHLLLIPPHSELIAPQIDPAKGAETCGFGMPESIESAKAQCIERENGIRLAPSTATTQGRGCSCMCSCRLGRAGGREAGQEHGGATLLRSGWAGHKKSGRLHLLSERQHACPSNLATSRPVTDHRAQPVCLSGYTDAVLPSWLPGIRTE